MARYDPAFPSHRPEHFDIMSDPNPDPIALFREWFALARACKELDEPTAMVLSTASPEGVVASRVVLLKDVSEKGFALYTNLGSAKARDLLANPNAALNFYWMPIDKQVRIVGRAEVLPDNEADAYFASRPRESQIGAWASDQSRELDSRATLEARYADYLKQFEGKPVPRPDFWSGFRIIPSAIEFWEARPSRLHDRRLFRRNPDGSWAAPVLLNP
jgi:pyridoxamine 5'-phosphate oxidase